MEDEARLLSLENNPEDDGDDENDKKLRKRVKRKRRTKDNGVKHVYSIKWKAKYGRCPLLPLASCVAALGGILFGYDIGIVSGAMLQLKEDFGLDCPKQEMIVTALVIGGLGASIVGGHIVDYFGRRIAIIINSIIFIAGALVLALSKSFSLLVLGRLLLGFAVALSATAECIYISEISPPTKRGFLVSLNELGITLGILLAYLVNYLLIKAQHGWRIMFGLSSIPAFLQAIGMALLPSSPRWLISRSRDKKAKRVIAALWPGVDTDEEVTRIKGSLSSEKGYNFSDLISTRENMRLRMVIGCGLVFFQQLTGQPTVLYYAPAVFQALGFKSGTSATLATVGLGVVKVVFTTLTLLTVDRLGRRSFLLLGATVMTASVIVLSAVTEPLHHLQTTNPCEKKVVSVSHHYVSSFSEAFPRGDFHKCNQTDNNHLQPTTLSPNSQYLTPSFLNNSMPVSMNNSKKSNKSRASQSFSQTRGFTLTTTQSTERTNIIMNHIGKNFTNRTENECSYDKKTKENKERLKQVSNGVKYASLIALMSFVAGYAIGYGPVSWLVLTEIFPVGIKGRAVSIATIFNWGTNIIISSTFLDVIGNIGPSWTFLIYAIIGVLATAFICHFIPETKRRTLERITSELNKKSVVCSRLTCCRNTETVSVQNNEESNESAHILEHDSAV